jgi:hypothetical protein
LKVVLRDPKRATYFVKSGTWSEDLKDARDFQTSVWAIEAAFQMKQEGLELLLLFTEPGHDMRMPIEILAPQAQFAQSRMTNV